MRSLLISLLVVAALSGCGHPVFTDAPSLDVEGVVFVSLYPLADSTVSTGNITAFCVEKKNGIATFLTVSHGIAGADHITVGPHADAAFIVRVDPDKDLVAFKCLDRDNYVALPMGKIPQRFDRVWGIGVVPERFLLTLPGKPVCAWIWYTCPGTIVTSQLGPYRCASMSIRRGFSGGPVLDDRGAIVGMMQMSDVPQQYVAVDRAGRRMHINPASANVYFITVDYLKTFLDLD